jgi:hypothetical protein
MSETTNRATSRHVSETQHAWAVDDEVERKIRAYATRRVSLGASTSPDASNAVRGKQHTMMA